MTWAEAYRVRVVLIVVPAIIVSLGLGVSLLPNQFVIDLLNLFAVWLALSVPLSVFVGRCMLSEPER